MTLSSRSVARTSLFAAVVAVVLSAAGRAPAASAPAYTVNPTFSGTVDTDPNAYAFVGFEFITDDDVYVTHLGYNANDEYAGTRTVAIVNDDGSPLSPALVEDVVVPVSGETGALNFVYTELDEP